MMHVYIYVYAPGGIVGKDMRRSRGTVAVYFKVLVQCNSSIGRQMYPCPKEKEIQELANRNYISIIK